MPLIPVLVLAGSQLLAPNDVAGAQGVAVVPLKGQSAKQVATDQRHCVDTAVQRSGYDPLGPGAAQRPPVDPARGGSPAAASDGNAAKARGQRPDTRRGGDARAFDDAFRACLGARGYLVQ